MMVIRQPATVRCLNAVDLSVAPHPSAVSRPLARLRNGDLPWNNKRLGGTDALAAIATHLVNEPCRATEDRTSMAFAILRDNERSTTGQDVPVSAVQGASYTSGAVDKAVALRHWAKAAMVRETSIVFVTSKGQREMREEKKANKKLDD